MDQQVGAPVADRQVRLPRTTGVKNKQPAQIQITAEQLLRESHALQKDEFKPAAVTITNPEELAGMVFRIYNYNNDNVFLCVWFCIGALDWCKVANYKSLAAFLLLQA